MRTAAALFLVAGVLISGLTGLDAGEKKKEITVKGTITCAKCDFDTVKAALPDLKKPSGCQTVIVTKKGDKSMVLFFDDASHKKHHGPICTESKKGTVTGTVTKKDGKGIISVSKLEFDK